MAALVPVRTARVAGRIVAALFGVLLALALALANQPNFALAASAFAAAAALWYAGWRDALSPEATAWHRATAAFVSICALLVLAPVIGAIGTEGGHCYLPSLPVGCLP